MTTAVPIFSKPVMDRLARVSEEHRQTLDAHLRFMWANAGWPPLDDEKPEPPKVVPLPTAAANPPKRCRPRKLPANVYPLNSTRNPVALARGRNAEVNEAATARAGKAGKMNQSEEA